MTEAYMRRLFLLVVSVVSTLLFIVCATALARSLGFQGWLAFACALFLRIRWAADSTIADDKKAELIKKQHH